MNYPKYIRLKGNKLYYQRDYPIKIKELIGKKTYSSPIGLDSTASATSIQRASLEHTERFELDCKTAQQSDIKAYSDAEIDKQALILIEKARLSVGELHQINEDLTGLDPLSAADIALGEDKVDSLVDKHNYREPLSFKDKALLRARVLLTTKRSKQLKTLSQLWVEYAHHRDIDLQSRNGKKAQKRWDLWFSFIGEQHATKDLNEAISDALQDVVDERERSIPKPSQSTIERELSDVMSALKLGSRRYGLFWNIQRPVIQQTASKQRYPLTKEEQLALMVRIFNKPLTKSQYRSAVLVLLYIQGGMMASEVQRLLPEDISLETSVPHLVIRNKTKTEARKRIVPLVLGVDLLKEHLDETIEWLQRITESTWSAAIKKFLRDSTGNRSLSGHCLRHSFKANAQAVNASVLTIASIAGWTEGQRSTSKDLLNYGSVGISSSEIIKQLYKDNHLINAHLIKIEKDCRAVSRDNVISFRR